MTARDGKALIANDLCHPIAVARRKEVSSGFKGEYFSGQYRQEGFAWRVAEHGIFSFERLQRWQ
jgi:hypothetical protein